MYFNNRIKYILRQNAFNSQYTSSLNRLDKMSKYNQFFELSTNNQRVLSSALFFLPLSRCPKTFPDYFDSFKKKKKNDLVTCKI